MKVHRAKQIQMNRDYGIEKKIAMAALALVYQTVAAIFMLFTLGCCDKVSKVN